MVGDRESIVDRTETIAAVTTLLLVTLGFIQVILGETISQSVALTANGFDCIGDGFVSGIVWVGLRFFKDQRTSIFISGIIKLKTLHP